MKYLAKVKDFGDYLENKRIAFSFTTYVVILLLPLLFAIILSVPLKLIEKNLFGSLSLALVVTLIHLFLNQRFSTIFLKVMGGLLAFISAGEIVHLSIFSSFPNKNVFFTLLETHVMEVSEFFGTYIGFKEVALPLLYLAAVIFWFRRVLNTPFKRGFNLFVFFAVIVISSYYAGRGSAYSEKKFGRYSVLRVFFVVNDYAKEMSLIQQSKLAVPPMNYIQDKQSSPAEDVIVIIIGESTSRNHMSLYGYSRDTNPYLSKADIIKFNNVVSPHSHTLDSLAKVLTFTNHAGPSPKDAPHLISLAKLAGYRTYWISNQAALGAWDTQLTVVANKADEKYFMNHQELLERAAVQPYDEVVFGPFNKVLGQTEQKKKFVVIHLLGTHTSYAKRYPEKFNKFFDVAPSKINLSQEENQDINHYDNAVLYNDWIVDQLIKKLGAHQGTENKLLIYFSDHSEEVYDFRRFSGHNEAAQSNYMFEIPFLVWASENHVLKNLLVQAKSNSSKLYSIEDVIHSIHDVMNIKTRDFEAKRSVFSSEFVEIPRKVGAELYQKKNYEFIYAKTKNNIVLAPKLMVHRTNTLEKLNHLKDRYSAFEVDVVYDGNGFDVLHPPAASIGLSFEKYLQQPGNFFFWLDCKNLVEGNASGIIMHLEELDKKYSIRDRILFESQNHVALRLVAKAGFKTSYYLPGYEGKSELDEVAYVTKVMPTISDDFSAISQSMKHVPILKRYLPGLDILTWKVDLSDSSDRKKIEALNQDQHIKIMLVKERTKYDR